MAKIAVTGHRARENGTGARFFAPTWHLCQEVGTERNQEENGTGAVNKGDQRRPAATPPMPGRTASSAPGCPLTICPAHRRCNPCQKPGTGARRRCQTCLARDSWPIFEHASDRSRSPRRALTSADAIVSGETGPRCPCQRTWHLRPVLGTEPAHRRARSRAGSTPCRAVTRHDALWRGRRPIARSTNNLASHTARSFPRLLTCPVPGEMTVRQGTCQ